MEYQAKYQKLRLKEPANQKYCPKKKIESLYGLCNNSSVKLFGVYSNTSPQILFPILTDEYYNICH